MHTSKLLEILKSPEINLIEHFPNPAVNFLKNFLLSSKNRKRKEQSLEN